MIDKIEVENRIKMYATDIDENDKMKRSKIEIIKELIETKDWDKTIQNEEDILDSNLLAMLLYEYSTSIEKITKGKMKYTDVLNKLGNLLGKFRLGDWKEEKGDSIAKYDGNPVTSEEFKRKHRNEFGAQTIRYIDENGKLKNAIVLYDGKNGNGIDLRNLNDIRHTTFHEWTHVLELYKVEEKNEEEVVLNGRSFKNNEKFENGEVWGAGLVTREFGENSIKWNNGNRIMHNQITEGFVELIARKVIAVILEKENINDVVDCTRYLPHTKVAQDVMNALGEEEVIYDFLSNASKLVNILEGFQIEDKDALHYMSDFINDQKYFGIIPECSQRTFLFNEFTENMINMFDVKKENVPSLRKKWEEKENNGTILEEVVNILEEHGNRKVCEMSDEEQKVISDYLKKYENILNKERTFYDTLESKIIRAKKQSCEKKNVEELMTECEDIDIGYINETEKQIKKEEKSQVLEEKAQ